MRSANEAYLSRVPGKTWAMFFLSGGSVRFDAREVNGSLQLRLLDIQRPALFTATTTPTSF